jgi:hypothetical protein
VLFPVEFRVFQKRQVPGPPNTPRLADHEHSFALQGLEFVTHMFCRGGAPFYDLDGLEQRYFRTPLWISCGATSDFLEAVKQTVKESRRI